MYEYMDVNVTAIESVNGILIIDSHRSPGSMKKIKQVIEKDFGRNDVLYVINTHGDYDHTSGNQVFPHATIIGHDHCPEHMRQVPANSPQTIRYFKSHINEMEEALKNRDKDLVGHKELPAEIEEWNSMAESIEKEYIITPPTKTFTDSLIIRLDDLTIKMMFCGNAHTDNDIFIYIPEERLVITGDVFTSRYSFGFSVNAMNDVQRVISSMNQILQDSSGLEYVIPGHGEYFSGNDLRALKDLLMERAEPYRTTLSAARFLESMIEIHGITMALQQLSEMESGKSGTYHYHEDEFSILGRKFLRKGKMEEAIGIFTLSTVTFPNSALGYDNLGAAYLKKGEIDSAIAKYEQSLRLFPAGGSARDVLNRLRRAK